jgi:hypothetical protein
MREIGRTVYSTARRQRYFDWIGFIALSVIPAIALYQGVAAAFGLPVVFDPTVEAMLGMAAITLCLVLRTRAIVEAISQRPVAQASLYLLGYVLIVLSSTMLAFINPIERDPSRMLQQFLATLPLVLMFFVMVSSPGPAAAIRSIKASLLVWAVAAVLTPLTAFTPIPIGEVQGTYVGSEGLRSFGVLGDGGTFVISFLAVAFFSSRRLFWLLLSMLALVLSGSRMALVIAMAGVALVLVLANPNRGIWRRGERAFRIVLATLPLVLFLIGLQIMISQVAAQLGAIDPIERLRESDIGQSDRFFSILQGLEWFKLSPIYGQGFNAYYYFSLRNSVVGANEADALNQIVQTLVDGGLLALTFLALFFIRVLWPTKDAVLIDRRNDPYAIKAWLFVFLILNQSAVYILPAFYLTALVFGSAGLSLHLEMTREPRAVRDASRPQHLHLSQV